MKNRLSDFILVDKQKVSSLFSAFDKKLAILDCSLIDNSMSNTGDVVTTTSGKYFLKLYSNTTDKVETAVYTFLQKKINVPELYYYDGSKQQFPFISMRIHFFFKESIQKVFYAMEILTI